MSLISCNAPIVRDDGIETERPILSQENKECSRRIGELAQTALEQTERAPKRHENDPRAFDRREHLRAPQVVEEAYFAPKRHQNDPRAFDRREHLRASQVVEETPSARKKQQSEENHVEKISRRTQSIPEDSLMNSFDDLSDLAEGSNLWSLREAEDADVAKGIFPLPPL